MGRELCWGKALGWVLILATVMAGCEEDESDTQAPDVAYLYVGSSGGLVDGLTVELDSGSLSRIGDAPFSGITAPAGFAARPDGEFLYLGSTTLSVRAIGAGGALSPVSGGAVPASQIQGIAIHPDGGLLFTAHFTGSVVSVWTLDEDTGVPALANTNATGADTYAIANSADGEYVYAAVYSLDQVESFSVDVADADLADTPGVSAVTQDFPFAIAAHPAGAHVLVVNNTSNDISVFDVDAADGDLTPNATVAVDAATSPGEVNAIAIHPSGDFVYVSGVGGVSAYAFDTGSGDLTELADSPFSAGATNGKVAIDASGAYLAVIDASGTVSLFEIDADDGSLAEVDDSPFATVPNPVNLAFVAP